MATTVICGNCATHTELEGEVKEHVYFHRRMVYNGENKPYVCQNCGDNDDIIIFGQQYISFLLGNARFETLINNKTIIESNRISYQKRIDQAPPREKEKYIQELANFNSMVEIWQNKNAPETNREQP